MMRSGARVLLGGVVMLGLGCGGGEGATDAFTSLDAAATDVRASEDTGALDAEERADDAPVANDVGSDDGGTSREDAALDASLERLDAAMAAIDAGVDATLSVDAFVVPDAPLPLDVGTDAARIGLGPVQCTPSLECPAGPGTCNEIAPGGVCSCFLGTEACPSGTSCDTDIGACIRSCATDLDCNAGMTCSTLTGRCQIRRCGDTTACPAPYVCSSATSGVCRRPSCAGGVSCPSSMTCVSEVCVEP